MLTVIPAQLSIDKEGLPFSTQYHDRYYSSSGPAEESKHVFINGNKILSRWNNGSDFTVAELGFGMGLNFLVTGNAWISRRPDSGFLHYIGVEKHPVNKKDLESFYSSLQIHSSLQDLFLEQYPLPINGMHRINLEDYRIRLNLFWEDGLSALCRSGFLADAWYLDGFCAR